MNQSSRAKLDPGTPNVARVYDYLLGGKDNFGVDREFVWRFTVGAPWVWQLARDNRAFLRRAVAYLAHAGVRQFLDIGTGLPTKDNVHQVAQRIAPDARIVYVDHDVQVLAHARALLTGTPEGRTAYVEADACDVSRILREAAREGIDFERPVGVLFVAILHFLPGGDAAATTAAFRDALAWGSYMVGSHAAPGMETVQAAYQEDMGTGTIRTPGEIGALFGAGGGWGLVDPGLVALPDWRPDEQDVDRSAAGLFLGGVARKSDRGGGRR